MKEASIFNPKKESFASFWNKNIGKYVKNPDDIQPKELHRAITDWYNENFKNRSAK